MAGRFEEHLRAEHVPVGVEAEVAPPASADAGLRGLVEDDGDAIEKRTPVGIREPRLMEREARPAAQRCEVPFLQSAGVVVGERIEAGDLPAALEQLAAQLGTDESGGAGDENFHDLDA